MKLRSIDSIRAVAILMVILVHTAQKIDGLDTVTRIFTKYCQMGVQLFFVASAYTLCLSAIRREDEALPWTKFAARRYFRIAPAYYLGIVLYFIISLATSSLAYGHPVIQAKYSLMNILSNLTFVHGFYPPANNSIVPGGWSIGTEMAFYAVFPFLFVVASRYIRDSTLNIVAFVIAGFVLSQCLVLLSGLLGHQMDNNTFIYYNIVNQLPVFMVGIGYFFMKKHLKRQWSWRVDFMLFIFSTVVAVALRMTGFKYCFSIIPFASGISFVFLMEIFQKVDRLNHNILVRVGQVSYSMYLIHPIFATIITGILAPKSGIEGVTSLMIFYILSVILTLSVARVTEKYIEKPSIDFGRKVIRNIRLSVVGNAANSR